MTEYGLKKAPSKLPEIDLLVVPHKGKPLVTARFGNCAYGSSLEEMKKHYFNSEEYPDITFRPATISESISTTAYNFSWIARPILDRTWIQAGRVVLTKDGVFTNTDITDEETLKQLLNEATEVNGIYLINDQTAFAPRETFIEGRQDSREFCNGGLAKALEHSEGEVAKTLATISDQIPFPEGINVRCNFDKNEKTSERVITLTNASDILGINASYWNAPANCGYAFGVQK